jgi:hypothetical protein
MSATSAALSPRSRCRILRLPPSPGTPAVSAPSARVASTARPPASASGDLFPLPATPSSDPIFLGHTKFLSPDPPTCPTPTGTSYFGTIGGSHRATRVSLSGVTFVLTTKLPYGNKMRDCCSYPSRSPCLHKDESLCGRVPPRAHRVSILGLLAKIGRLKGMVSSAGRGLGVSRVLLLLWQRQNTLLKPGRKAVSDGHQRAKTEA